VAGGGGYGGAEIGGGGGSSGRVGWEEGAEASCVQNGPSSTGRVWVASETLVSAGRTRILGLALNFFFHFRRLTVLIYDIFLARTHN
jgi:hypothetical protein